MRRTYTKRVLFFFECVVGYNAEPCLIFMQCMYVLLFKCEFMKHDYIPPASMYMHTCIQGNWFMYITQPAEMGSGAISAHLPIPPGEG